MAAISIPVGLTILQGQRIPKCNQVGVMITFASVPNDCLFTFTQEIDRGNGFEFFGGATVGPGLFDASGNPQTVWSFSTGLYIAQPDGTLAGLPVNTNWRVSLDTNRALTVTAVQLMTS